MGTRMRRTSRGRVRVQAASGRSSAVPARMLPTIGLRGSWGVAQAVAIGAGLALVGGRRTERPRRPAMSRWAAPDVLRWAQSGDRRATRPSGPRAQARRSAAALLAGAEPRLGRTL